MSELNLQELSVHYGSDKCDGNHTVNGRNYLDVYRRYLQPFQSTASVVVEVGVLKGASLRMWRDYFDKAYIWGLDHNPLSVFSEPRITSIQGEQDNPSDLDRIAPGQSIDIAIDDASHLNELTLATFAGLWPRIVPGGLYIIEDLRTSYGEFAGHLNRRQLMDDFFNAKIALMDDHRGDCGFIHFWPMLAILEKAK